MCFDPITRGANHVIREAMRVWSAKWQQWRYRKAARDVGRGQGKPVDFDNTLVEARQDLTTVGGQCNTG
jgi:Arc/MetJ-type ribon-helix-helix transcriptional regulator